MNHQNSGGTCTPTPRFTGIFIPVEILEMSELTLLEQMLLAWIDALYCADRGGCFASNEYLASRLKVQENTIAKAITRLRSLGLIEDVAFDGRRRVIRALIGKFVDYRHSQKPQSQSNSALDLNPTLGWTKIQPCHGEKSNPPIYKVYSKDESKEYTPPYPPKGGSRECDFSSSDTHTKKKSPKEPKPQSSPGPIVVIPEPQLEKFYAEHGKTLIDALIAEMEDYCRAHGKRYKDYAAALRNWMRNRKKDQEKAAENKKNTKMRAADTGEYSTDEHEERCYRRGEERLKRNLEEAMARKKP